MQKVEIVASVDYPIQQARIELPSVAISADFIELRGDLNPGVGSEQLRDCFSGRLIYSLLDKKHGGGFDGSRVERSGYLLNAARQFDFVDLDADQDLHQDTLSAIPAGRRIISWHGGCASGAEMRRALDRALSVPAAMYKLVTTASRSGDELDPLILLNERSRTDVIAFAAGERGLWTRLLAPFFGAPVVFGSAQSTWSPNDDPPVRIMVEDYGFPDLQPVTDIYGIAGNPIRHSLSPRLHNAAYRELGLPALFFPFLVDSFGEFWRRVAVSGKLEQLGLTLRGITVASPCKEAPMEIADEVSLMARRACSSNVFRRNNGDWIADTTDPQGVVLPLMDRGLDVRGRRAAVVGCGGAGRAIAAALDHAGARVSLVNRGPERGTLASGLLGLPYVPLSEFSVQGFSIIVNATPVGRNSDELPFLLHDMEEDAVVIDLVYGAEPSRLVTNALGMDRAAISGRDVLLVQARRQFELMTGSVMPEEMAREILGYSEKEILQAAQVI